MDDVDDAHRRVGAVVVESGESDPHAVAARVGGVGDCWFGAVVAAVDIPLDPLSPAAGVGGGERQLPVGERLGADRHVRLRGGGDHHAQPHCRVASLRRQTGEREDGVVEKRSVMPLQAVAGHGGAVRVTAVVEREVQGSDAVAAVLVGRSDGGVGRGEKGDAVPRRTVTSREGVVCDGTVVKREVQGGDAVAAVMVGRGDGGVGRGEESDAVPRRDTVD